MHIVLADPPKAEESYDLSYPNLGILYLTSSLRKHFGSQHRISYLEGFYDLATHLKRLEDLKPDIYGLSFATMTSKLSYRTINTVRKRFPTLPILCGGTQPTAAYNNVFKRSEADVCVIGEGEETICDLVQHYTSPDLNSLRKIPGIAFRSHDQVIKTEPRKLIQNLGSIEQPAWDLIDFSKYSGMHFRKADPQTMILVSRGCPFDCNFCSNPVWKCSKPWVRLRKAEGIASEIYNLHKLGLKELYLSADEFNINLPWALEVANAISDLNLDLYFQCNVRADKVNDKLAAALARMKLWMVHIGIESGNQQTLDGIGKNVTLDQIKEAATTFQRHGVKVFAFFMLYHAWEENGSLCYETPLDVKNTLRFASELFKKKLINYMSWQIATPMPGSRLWGLALKHDILRSKENLADFREMAMNLPGVSEREVKRSLRKGYRIKLWHALKEGNINFHQLWRGIAVLRILFGIRRSRHH